MPEKYICRDGLPLLVRHTGPTTLPQDPPARGTGPAVVCLHDAGLQGSVFADLLTALEGEACAIAFDLPGHGRSGSLDSLGSIEAMTEMARWVVDRCRLERPIVVGHGMGALIALEWARGAKEDVAGLVLCGAGLALGIDDPTIETMRNVTLGKAPRPFDPTRVCQASGPDMMRRAYMEGTQTDPRATLVDLEASRAWSDAFAGRGDGTKNGGGSVVSSSLVCAIVRGSEEAPICRKRAESLAQSLSLSPSRTTTCEIEGAAHFLPLEKPDALAAEILRLARLAEAA
jgi:pimeloyl-ACP methyl ester carboxylesterase